VKFSLSPGQAGDVPHGRKLLLSKRASSHQVIMDRAYEGDETSQLVQELEMTPVVPPKRNRLAPWDYDPKIGGHA
jgi:hypothetical protein